LKKHKQTNKTQLQNKCKHKTSNTKKQVQQGCYNAKSVCKRKRANVDEIGFNPSSKQTRVYYSVPGALQPDRQQLVEQPDAMKHGQKR